MSIPADLVVNACFDGSRLVLSNPTVFVLRMSAQGEVGAPIRRLPGAPSIPASAVALNEPEAAVMPPGYGLTLPVGTGAVSVRLGGDPRGNRRYVLARSLSQFLPDGFSVYEDFAALVEEVDEAGLTAQRCLDASNYLGDAACSLRFARDMTAALGSFFAHIAVPVVEVVVKRSLTFLVAFLDTALWAKDAVDQAEQFVRGARQLSIAAAPVTTAPTTLPPTTMPPSALPPTTVPALPPEQVAQRFWEATLASDRARAIEFGTADAFDLLRTNLAIPGATAYHFRGCGRVEPGSTYRGVLYTRGAALCSFGAPDNQFAFFSLIVVPTGTGRHEVRGVSG